MINIINVAEIAVPGWNFVEDYYESGGVEWLYFSANPQNFLERLITRPKLSRYRACIQATGHLTKHDLVISHLPRMTHWQSQFMNTLGRNKPHLAFSFNFTDLPGKKLRRAMIQSFSRVDSFVVYSQFEKKRYAEFFEIPEEKIHMLHWAMSKPVIDASYQVPEKEFYCAVGGEGRDYRTLIDAFSKLKDLSLVIVTRPGMLNGVEIPDNVKVLYNLSNQQFWSVVSQSKAAIVPLLNENVACGHITLVGAMKLGKMLISSFSNGTADYIVDQKTGLIFPPGDSEALQRAIETVENNPDLRQKIEANCIDFAARNCDLVVWAEFVKKFKDRFIG